MDVAAIQQREATMTNAFKESLEQASKLPIDEREELAYFLLRSVESEAAEIQAEWLALAEQRVEEMRSGKVVGIPGEEVLAELRKSYP
jgi:putative addiction module component (TIGR02574 family)